MKIRLLNDGGYAELSGIKFPLEVEGKPWFGSGFDVAESEFYPHGFEPYEPDYMFYFSPSEVEVVE